MDNVEMDITEGAVLLTKPGDFCHMPQWVIAPQPPSVTDGYETEVCRVCDCDITKATRWAVIPIRVSYHLWPRHACSRGCALALIKTFDEMEMKQHFEENEMKARHSGELQKLGEKHREKRRLTQLRHRRDLYQVNHAQEKELGKSATEVDDSAAQSVAGGRSDGTA